MSNHFLFYDIILSEVHVHLGKDYLESHIFYPKYGYVEYKDCYMKKQL